MKHFVKNNGQICNVNDENEVLNFSEIDLTKKCTTAELEKEELETQEAFKKASISKR